MIGSIRKLVLGNTVLKNFSVLTFSTILTQLLNIFTSIKIARAVDPTILGTYNLLQVHIGICVVLASIGLRNIIIRTIAREKTSLNQVVMLSLIVRLAGLVITTLLYIVYYYYFKNFGHFLFIMVFLGIVSSILFDQFESVTFGLEKMEFSGFINLITTGIWFVVILLLPAKYFTLNSIFTLFVGLNIIKTLLYILSLYRSGYLVGFFKQKIDKDKTIEITKESLPYYYMNLFTLLSIQIPLLFLEYRSGVEQIGFFNLAGKVLSPMSLVLHTALSAIFPNLSKLFVTNYPSFIKNVKTIFITLALMGITGAFGVTFFRKEVILLLYGEKYISTSLALGYQCWYLAVYALVCLVGTILGAINQQKVLSYLSVVCTVIQVPILWVGAKYGAEYFSAAFLAATFITFLLHLYIINQHLKKDLSLGFYIKIILLFVVAYTVSLLIPVELHLLYKSLIFCVIALGAGYFFYKKYSVLFAKN